MYLFFHKSFDCIIIFHSDLLLIIYNLFRIFSLPSLSQLAPNLRYLDATANSLRDISGLKDCVRLEELYLGFNEIPEEQITVFKKLPTLRVLDISHNKFKYPKLIDVLADLRNLEVLVNTLNDFPKLSLTSFCSLKELSLDGNKLIDLKIKNGMGELRVLAIKNNQISMIKGLENCSLLKNLICDANCLETISKIQELSRLEVLSAPYNKIATMESLAATKVRMVNLSKNYLRDLDFTSGCKELEHLSVSNNKLKRLASPSTPLGLLKTADLSY
jgi:Leucine-rich repeat (LRR) protein